MAVMARYNTAGLSDPGRRREKNEDRYYADPDRGIYLVIDGVGGQAAGEKAADTALQILRARLERQVGTPADRIREAITLANNEIFRLASGNDDWHGMACVLTVAVLDDGTLTVGQVGDSRLYLVQPGAINKVTRDHSPVGEREDRGEFDELTAMRHPRRNEVYRDVGSQQHSPDDPDFIEITNIAFPPDAALLLCSDGLTDLVTSRQILGLIEQNAGNPHVAAKALIGAANEAGGKDNITVVLVEGPRFPAAVRRRMSSPRTTIPVEPIRPRWFTTPLACIIYGLILAAALVFFLKPHWLDTQSGIQLGLGPVREARTWRVSTDINNAVARAAPGDTVVVAPGTYNEQVRLREGIRLVSERPREAILRANGVAITAEDVRHGSVEGFRVQPDDSVFLQVGIQLINSSVEVVDNEVTGTVTAGIELQASPNAIVRANSVDATSRAALLISGDGAGPRVVHNVLAAKDHPAVVVAGTAHPVFRGNVIRAAEPLFLPPHVDSKELLLDNTVTSIHGPRSGRNGRSQPRLNAPARVR
jgi:serine/threonine protein phosphatase PrpC